MIPNNAVPASRTSHESKPTKKEVLQFLIPSLCGVLIFLFPFPWGGEINVPIGIISESLAEFIKPIAPLLIAILICLNAFISTVTILFKPRFILEKALLAKLFYTTPYYVSVRVLGSIITVMCYFGFGPALVIAPDTGLTMLNLSGTLIAWFFTASFLIPLLMNFGIMEYVGTFVSDYTRPLFKIPGRSAVDLLASWVGNCNVGVVLTTSQYEKGYYTAKEAIIISTCFSAVSLPFCLVIAAMLDVDSLFFPFYAIVCITGIASIIIMTRIPPLCKYPDEYLPNVGKQVNEQVPAGIKKSEWALKQGVNKAKSAASFTGILYEGLDMFLGIIFILTPIVMCYGTIALILATYTPIFNLISLPFGYYLDFFGVQEAFAAAPATIAGFADMIIPAVLAANIESFETRFIIGALSLVQIIYMTEVGTLIITSKMPIRFFGLLVLFIEKTLIAVPLIILLMKLFGISG
ncbi:YjiH family protein [Bacillus tuaregi]|uniref:YjiH family protein n=1 Tax=Bacillus tuaregi TaxID=1816695 RepID=UPI0009FE237F|nr:YjiH family protein [Bacillus tuaregi]